jgi:hypothetical protein
MYLPIFWCDGESSFYIVKFEGELEELNQAITELWQWQWWHTAQLLSSWPVKLTALNARSHRIAVISINAAPACNTMPRSQCQVPGCLDVHVRFAELLWLKVLFTNLLWKRNNARWLLIWLNLHKCLHLHVAGSQELLLLLISSHAGCTSQSLLSGHVDAKVCH